MKLPEKTTFAIPEISKTCNYCVRKISKTCSEWGTQRQRRWAYHYGTACKVFVK